MRPPGRQMRVVPYVKDTKNALVMRLRAGAPGPRRWRACRRPSRRPSRSTSSSNRGNCPARRMPSPRERKEILFYEASEGGAGVLRQLVEDPTVIPRLARRALEICHFDPDTLEDKAAETCGKACYECLLDYGNQPDHQVLDRFLIRDLLAQTGAGDLPARRAAPGRARSGWLALRKRCDSELEKKWLDLLDEPDAAPAESMRSTGSSGSTRTRTSTTTSTTRPSTSTARRTTRPEQIAKDEEITRRLHGAWATS